MKIYSPVFRAATSAAALALAITAASATTSWANGLDHGTSSPAGPEPATILAPPLQLPATPVADTTRSGGGLVPGDLVRLRIWREPDLSGEYVVNADGVVVLPKIGAQQVLGESREALQARLMERYAEYLRNPSIEVTFLHRINVLGSVREPGLIEVDPTMVVADVIALAGGVLPEGRINRIRLLRGETVLTADVTQRTRISDLPLQSGDQLYVPEKEWYRRNSVGTTFVSAGMGLLSVLITIALTR